MLRGQLQNFYAGHSSIEVEPDTVCCSCT